MQQTLLRTNKEISEIYYRHINTVYRVCFMYVKNQYDTEDMVQTTFIKLMKSNKSFDNIEHEKAWLIVTASNTCKDFLKHSSRKNIAIDDMSEIANEPSFEIDETIKLILSLPEKIKETIYMYYYEGYKSFEIAKLLKKNESTIRGYLHKGRELLRIQLGGNFYEK
ncbi:MAG: RNA polymerase sigma factor [Oscillospiraceae bacterium]